MKLHFDANLDYQREAVDAVCDLFLGQELSRGEFTVTASARQGAFGFHQGSLGIGNRMLLLEEEMLANLKAVQLRHGLPPSSSLEDAPRFTVEMETGTGKTYVYLRTIFELNRRYGFTKFVIVVPSVAIKEGVNQSLQMMEEHFRGLYANVVHQYFVYDSARLGEVRNFAVSPDIQIMIATVGAINKPDVNNLYKPHEQTGGEAPIDLIRATRPILIVDEPQSVDGGLKGQGREALQRMQPLCQLRYSATHRDLHHPVFKLDAVDAYERGLVKQIEVAAGTVESGFNRAYVKVLGVSARRTGISAKLELDVRGAAGVSRKTVTVRGGEALEELTHREIYCDCRVGEIQAGKVEVLTPGEQHWLEAGQEVGGADGGAIARQMIRRTIREHLAKEVRLRPQGFKVLSLFFIDRVEKYRRYEGEEAKPGEYAAMFEEEYRKLAGEGAEEVHDGYFSQDKSSKRWKDTRGDSQADESAYALIMRAKEKLLSFDSKLKFIFSHSALREGWDNPNVFQICALREMGSETERRQTIGRGLRLAVNQAGERVRGAGVNTLTVVATESYEQFAEGLQKELSATGVEFGTLKDHVFAGVERPTQDGGVEAVGYGGSKRLWEHLHAAGYVSVSGHVQDGLRRALRDGTLDLPTEFQPCAGAVEVILKRACGRVEIKDADTRRVVKARKAVLESAEFRALWDRIKHKTTYRVQFDNEQLVERCTQALGEAPSVPQTRLQWTLAGVMIERAGVGAKDVKAEAAAPLGEAGLPLPDILTELQNRTQLTRRSLARILRGSNRLEGFLRNPQAFVTLAAEVINRAKQLALVDGIKYRKLGDSVDWRGPQPGVAGRPADARASLGAPTPQAHAAHTEVYSQELFASEELMGYLRNTVPSSKGVYEEVVWQSEGEARFARQLEDDTSVKVYAKLPAWFTVPTPLGTYNPDWAVLIERDGTERLYLVVETKGSLFADDLREREAAKIRCGKAHFQALATGENPARFRVATQVSDLWTEE